VDNKRSSVTTRGVANGVVVPIDQGPGVGDVIQVDASLLLELPAPRRPSRANGVITSEGNRFWTLKAASEWVIPNTIKELMHNNCSQTP
jgi:hypothetical protein